MRVKIKHLLVVIFLLFSLFFVPVKGANNMDSLFSAFIRQYPHLPEDTQTINLLYEIAILSSEQDISGYSNKYNKSLPSAEANAIIALNMSCKLKYLSGVRKYFDIAKIIFNQKTSIPLIDPFPYDDWVNEKNLKPLNRYRHRTHYGSLDMYLNVREKMEKSGIYEELSQINYWIGLYYLDLLNYKKAITYFLASLNYIHLTSGSNLFTNILQEIGVAYYKLNQLDSATRYFIITEKHLDNNFNSYAMASCLNNLGEVYYKQRQFTKALNSFDRSLEIFTFLKDTDRMAIGWLKLGKTLIEQEAYGRSEQALTKAMHLGKKSENLRNCLYFLSECYHKSGQHSKDYTTFSKFVRIKDSLFATEVNSFLKNNDARWQNILGREISKKERESITRKDLSLELNKSKFYLFALSMGIVMFSILAYFAIRANRNKKRANLYLNELNRSRDRFYSMVAHDLRSPMIGYILLLEHLLQKFNQYNNADIYSQIQMLTNSANDLKLLLDNMLEWSKSQIGKSTYISEKILLNDIIAFYANLYMPVAREKNIKLISKIQGDLYIMADKNMMELVIRNLLSNAIRYNTNGGEVYLDASVQNQLIEVSIIDTGVGLTEDEIKYIFNDNNYSNSIEKPTIKGAGIGLKICKEYLEKSGGRLYATSEGKNKGSRFIFTIKMENTVPYEYN